ncbi:MAG: DUF456 domain-containing protein [Bacteroidales bacterium]|nr:DUF456 domain-containing protein [Bacteroidales bacterium]
MDYLLIVLAIVALIVGLIGDVIPGVPGTPISFLALLLLHWTQYITYSTQFLAITGLICVAITVLDYVVPVWGTKKFGGTKSGVRGSTIGLIVSVFVLPFLGIVIGPFGIIGILAGPFIGAYIGEKMGGTPDNLAWRSAFGSFVGFVTGTLMKIIYTLVIGFYVVKDIVLLIFD